jgi:hypothetical protein
MFKKLLSVALFASSVLSPLAHADNAQWFKKVQEMIPYGDYFGRTAGLLINSGCSMNLAPSDKNGLLVSMKKSKRLDILNLNEKPFGDIHVLPTDALIGYSENPAHPVETDQLVAFGFKADAASPQKSLVVEILKRNRVRITIEVIERGELKSTSCVFSPDREDRGVM